MVKFHNFDYTFQKYIIIYYNGNELREVIPWKTETQQMHLCTCHRAWHMGSVVSVGQEKELKLYLMYSRL